MKWLLTAWRRLHAWRTTLTCGICGAKFPNDGDRDAQIHAAYDHWLTKHSHEGWED